MEDVIHIPLSRGKVAIIDASMAGVSLTYQFSGGTTWTGCVLDTKWHAVGFNRKFYARSCVTVSTNLCRNISLHRLLMQAPPLRAVDHRDGDGLNCCLSNLRFATITENNRNSRPKNGRRFKGIHKEPGKNWRVQITIGKLRIRQRGFATEEDAAREYDRLALIYHGEFARLNFPGVTA